jgi:hypothetical protein
MKKLLEKHFWLFFFFINVASLHVLFGYYVGEPFYDIAFDQLFIIDIIGPLSIIAQVFFLVNMIINVCKREKILRNTILAIWTLLIIIQTFTLPYEYLIAILKK